MPPKRHQRKPTPEERHPPTNGSTTTYASDADGKAIGGESVLDTPTLRSTEKPVKERKVTALTEIKDKFPYFVSLLNTPHTRGRPELREEDVKGECLADRLRRNIQYWEGIGSSDFVLDIIKTGYKIPFIHNSPISLFPQ